MFNTVLGILPTTIKQVKEIKGMKYEKSLLLFLDKSILYIKHPKEFSRKTPTTDKYFQPSIRIKC